ncbi:MAG TPA: hypothetical protein DCE42_21255 [Myxococcales bacterium]|nr:hypothetical protein [Myxococcales bacterium]
MTIARGESILPVPDEKILYETSCYVEKARTFPMSDDGVFDEMDSCMGMFVCVVVFGVWDGGAASTEAGTAFLASKLCRSRELGDSRALSHWSSLVCADR